MDDHDDPDSDRVFIFVRLRLGERVLARTKIREFGGLGTLLADFLRTLNGGDGLDLSDVELTPGAAPVMEYVDANSGDSLIAFRVDPGQGERVVVAGRIPCAYRRRMLDPKASSFSSDRFVERAAPDLSQERKDELARRLVESRFDLLARIREALDADGNFEVQLPIGDVP